MAEAVIRWTNGRVNFNNVLNFLKTGGYDQTAIDNLAALVDLAVDTYFLPLIASTADYVLTDVRGLTSASDLFATNGTNAGAGSAAGNPVPSNVAYVITLGTGFTGRSYRGRFYMPALTTAHVAGDDNVTSTYSDAVVDAVADLLADALTAGWTPVVLSRVTGGAPRATAIGTPITDIIARNTTTDSQRRRLGKDH